ncbi:MAG TPA: AAC(3) family N-acetyltransferase [Anaerolineae bacterium]|nr:AAC(3) family N-acetyltransferase [Anaerolineae bacterium]
MASNSVGVRDIFRGLRSLGLTLPSGSAVIVHASLSSFGYVRGGARAVLAALLWTCDTIVLPAFTYQSMVWPLVGPPDNGMTYGHPEFDAANRNATFFHRNLPAHRDMGVIAETLRRHSIAVRSSHPVLSFVAAGKRAGEVLAGQTLDDPLAPIEWLQRHDGDVLLLGVGHTRNASIHLAERLAGRRQFMRWAIVRGEDSRDARAVRLPGFPGCSDGFDAIEPEIAGEIRQVTIGGAVARRVPLSMLIPIAAGLIADQADALLCNRPDCERCSAVRRAGR